MNKANLDIKSKEINNYFVICINNKIFIDNYKKPVKFFEKKSLHKIISHMKKKKSITKLYQDNILKLLQFNNGITKKNKSVCINEILNYVDTDSTCYIAEKGTELEALQKCEYQKLFSYSKKKYGIELLMQSGVMPLKQNIKNHIKIKSILERLDFITLTYFYHITHITYSIIISLNLLDNQISPKHAWKIINIENNYNSTNWGKDKENEKKLLLKKKLFTDIIRFKKYFTKAGDKYEV